MFTTIMMKHHHQSGPRVLPLHAPENKCQAPMPPFAWRHPCACHMHTLRAVLYVRQQRRLRTAAACKRARCAIASANGESNSLGLDTARLAPLHPAVPLHFTA
jgi:hypothetical protein